jgi:hypothetical protein
MKRLESQSNLLGESDVHELCTVRHGPELIAARDSSNRRVRGLGFYQRNSRNEIATFAHVTEVFVRVPETHTHAAVKGDVL